MRTLLGAVLVSLLVIDCSGEEYSVCGNNPDPYAGNDTYTVTEDLLLD